MTRPARRNKPVRLRAPRIGGRTVPARGTHAALASNKTAVGDLVAARAALEGLIIQLTDAVKHRLLGCRARGVAGETAKKIAAIETLIVKARAQTLQKAILKLTLFGALQGYLRPQTHAKRPAAPIEQKLFSSAIADLARMAERSSDRASAFKARK